MHIIAVIFVVLGILAFMVDVAMTPPIPGLGKAVGIIVLVIVGGVSASMWYDKHVFDQEHPLVEHCYMSYPTMPRSVFEESYGKLWDRATQHANHAAWLAAHSDEGVKRCYTDRQ